jgi:DNA-binding transcriptional LysR family regulator
MNRLEAMSVLIAVVEAGSFSAASRKLRAPLPTLSRKVFEAHLDTQLLIRSTRRLTLTDAGAAYVAACKRILEQVDDAERAASGEYVSPRGDLVTTAPVVFGRLHVLPAIEEFLTKYSEIDVRLLLSDRTVHLIEDHIDVAVRIGTLPDSTMMTTRLGAVRRVVCASPAYLDRVGVPAAPEDLAAIACITFEGLTPADAWSFTKAGSPTERMVPIRSPLTVNTAEAAIDAAIAGVGATRVLSYQVARAVAAGKLKIVLAEYEPAPLPISLVHVKQSLLPVKTRAFLDFVAPRIRARAAEAALPIR